MPIDAPTSLPNELCYQSYTLAQVYVEWRLEPSIELYNSIEEIVSELPYDVSVWVVNNGNAYAEYGSDKLLTFPIDAYAHCVRMWNESRKYVLQF